MMQFTFGKKERISSRNQIEALFTVGQTFNVAPFRVVYIIDKTAPQGGVRVLFSVPKRKFKKAVTRNRIKRLIREAYRLNKHALSDKFSSSSVCLYIGFIYIRNEEHITQNEISKALISCLERMNLILEHTDLKQNI